MGKKKRDILFVILGFVIFLVLGTVFLLFGRVSKNPAGTVGNTAGNLYNKGLFCEYAGTVYFSNSSDGGSLFAMNADESNVRRLNALNVRNILAGGKYLYYYQTGSTVTGLDFGRIPGMRSFERCRLNGKDTTTLTPDDVLTCQLVDNYLYFLTSTYDGPSFYKMKIDKSEEIELANLAITPASVQNGKIYYNGVDGDHYLYALNTANDVVSEVWKGNIWYPIVDGDYVYYLDVENNYRLCRYSMSQNLVEVLTNDRVDCFNVGNGFIYYQKNSPDKKDTYAQLKCMYTNGSNVQVIADGIFTNINMTSRYVYFQPYGDESTTYHSPLGSNIYSVFSPVED